MGTTMAFIRPSLVQDRSLVLRTGAVMLRPPRMPDYAEWAMLRGASRAHLTPFEPQWSEDELSRAAFRDRMRRYQHDARSGEGFAFFVFAAGSDHLVGGITLSNVRRGVSQAASIGYWIGAPMVRRGFATAALQSAARFAFEDLRLHRLEAACLPSNEASLRTLERQGFVREGLGRGYLKINGRWQDHVLLALCREDWPATGHSGNEGDDRSKTWESVR